MIESPPPQHDFPAPPSLGMFVPGGLALGAGRGWAWYQMAWALFTKQPVLWYIFFILFIGTQMLTNLLPHVVGSLVGGMVLLYGLAALVEVAIKIHAGKDVDVGDIFQALRGDYFLNLLLVLALQLLVIGLAIFIGIFLANGLAETPFDVSKLPTLPSSNSDSYLLMVIALCVIPGIMFSMLLNFAVPLIVINKIPVMLAIRKMLRVSVGNFMPFLVCGLVSLLLTLGCVLTLGLGLLLFIPINFLLFFTIYQDIFYRPNASPTAA